MANVVQKKSVAAFNVDSYNRTAVCADDIQNGCVFKLESYSANAGESKVWTATAPVADTDTGLWMAASPEVNITKIGDAPAGLPDLLAAGTVTDPRYFVNIAGRMIDAILLQKGDIIEMTGDGITDIDVNDFLIPTAGDFPLVSAAAAGTGLTLKKIGTSILHIGSTGLAKEFPVTYKFEVVNN